MGHFGAESDHNATPVWHSKHRVSGQHMTDDNASQYAPEAQKEGD